MPALAEQLARLPSYLGAHISLSGLALAIGVATSLPLAIAIARLPRIAAPILALAGVIQTIPGLALLALLVAILGTFGFVPALIALVLYAALPILRNTITGIRSIDPVLVAAAHTLGMDARQRVRLVELPLALPMIVAGVRTAAVWVIGTATLSTPVGQPSLGNYIFAGLQTRTWIAVVVGCTAAAVLAVWVDALLARLERAVTRRRRAQAGLVTTLVVLTFASGPVLVALGDGQGVGVRTAGLVGGESDRARTDVVRIGAKTFTEQYILAAALEAALARAGVATTRVESLGSAVAFDALAGGAIDVYVDYSGTLWTNAMGRTQIPARWRMAAELTQWLAEHHGIRNLGELGFENAYGIAMRRDRAAALGVTSLADLGPLAGELRLGCDYEFLARPEWQGVRDTYALAFADTPSFDASLLYDAVRDGEVDLITAFTSDGRIAAYDLAVLDDPAHALPPYDAIVLLGPLVADDARVVDALTPLVGSIDIDRMRRANALVDRDGRSPDAAAGTLSPRE